MGIIVTSVFTSSCSATHPSYLLCGKADLEECKERSAAAWRARLRIQPAGAGSFSSPSRMQATKMMWFKWRYLMIMWSEPGSRQGRDNSLKINNHARPQRGKMGKQSGPADPPGTAL